MEGPRVEVAPFRTIADFVTDATFTSPAVSESGRWYNRVKQNLLYYQTNYFVIFILIIVFYSAVNMARYLTGMFIITLILGALTLKTRYGLMPAAGIGLLAGLMGHTPAVMYTVCSIFIPILLSFIHASLRTRNMKNKMNSAVETLRVVPTPMAHILECLEANTDYFKRLASMEKTK